MSERLARTGQQEAGSSSPLPHVSQRTRIPWLHAANDNRLSLRRWLALRGPLLLCVILILAVLLQL